MQKRRSLSYRIQSGAFFCANASSKKTGSAPGWQNPLPPAVLSTFAKLVVIKYIYKIPYFCNIFNHNVPNDPSFKRFCDIFLSAVIVIKYVSTKCQIISCFCGTARHTSTVYHSDHNAAAVHYPSRRGCLAAQYALYHHVLLQKHLLTKLKLSCGSTMF